MKLYQKMLYKYILIKNAKNCFCEIQSQREMLQTWYFTLTIYRKVYK